MSVEETAEITHPGPILRAAREELRMSLEQVADALHLRPSVVALIESESYEEFSSDVFLKGYFRSYCRLVNLHEERMIELLENQLRFIASEKAGAKKAAADKVIKEKRVQVVKVIAVLGLLVLAGLLVFALAGSDAQNQGAIVEQISATTPDVLVSSEDELLISETMAHETHDLIAEAEVLRGEALVTASDEKPSVADLLARGEIAGASGAIDGLASVAIPGRLEVSFVAECWFEAYDPEGVRLAANLKRTGEQFIYDGAYPVRLVLGNGKAASLTLSGEPLDISSHIGRSGRAELKIDENAVSEG